MRADLLRCHAFAEDQSCGVLGVDTLAFWKQHVVSFDWRFGKVTKGHCSAVGDEFIVDVVWHFERQPNWGECGDDRVVAVQGRP